MATQIVMDPYGDTRLDFDATERRVKALTGAGFTAARRNADGTAAVIRTFDPTADEMLFFPRLVGG